jgi:hypothetical protein
VTLTLAAYAAGLGLTGATYASAGSAVLDPNEVLTSGQSLVNGHFQMVLGSDGNLVLDQFALADARWYPIWASRTPGHPGAYLAMQGDGNLVLYTRGGTAFWSTRTNGHAGAIAVLGSDGQFAVQGSTYAYWESGTSGDPDGDDKLFPGDSLQSYGRRISQDGSHVLVELENSLELLHGSSVTWHVGGYAFCFDAYAAMQTDSNFVDYCRVGNVNPLVLWASYTKGDSSDGAYLKVQNDGNVVIYSDWGQPLWSSGTQGR